MKHNLQWKTNVLVLTISWNETPWNDSFCCWVFRVQVLKVDCSDPAGNMPSMLKEDKKLPLLPQWYRCKQISNQPLKFQTAESVWNSKNIVFAHPVAYILTSYFNIMLETLILFFEPKFHFELIIIDLLEVCKLRNIQFFPDTTCCKLFDSLVAPNSKPQPQLKSCRNARVKRKFVFADTRANLPNPTTRTTKQFVSSSASFGPQRATTVRIVFD